MDYIEQTVRIAQGYGYKQLFTNEGAELVNILHRLHKRMVQKDYAGDISGAFAKKL